MEPQILAQQIIEVTDQPAPLGAATNWPTPLIQAMANML
jgi:hypothetical protein